MYTHPSTAARRGQVVKIRAAGRVVGVVKNGVFEKRIHFSRHALRTPPALALDLGSLADAEQAGARYVAITDAESGHCYRVSISTIRGRGWTLDRGYGRQVALALGEWRRDVELAGEQLALELA